MTSVSDLLYFIKKTAAKHQRNTHLLNSGARRSHDSSHSVQVNRRRSRKSRRLEI